MRLLRAVLGRSVLGALALLLATGAQATPVTYALDHGSTTAKVWLNGSLIAVGGGHLTGGFVQIDTATGQITNFSLNAANVNAFAPLLPGAYDGLNLDITLTPGAGYTSTATGSNPFAVTLGPIQAAFSGFVLDTSPPVTVPPQPVSGVVPINSFGVTALLSQGEMRLGLFGLKVGDLLIGGRVFDVRADIEFVGFVVAPEPALAGMLGLALLGLAGARLRHT